MLKFKIDNQKPIPKYYQLAEVIKKYVNQGKLKVGDRLPPERELAARCQINKLTVVRALSELVHEGVVYREQGRGTFVARKIPLQKISTSIGILGLGIAEDNSLFSTILQGVKRQAHISSCDLRLLPTVEPWEIEKISNYIASLDGLIIIYLAQKKEYLEVLKEEKVPFILVGKYAKDVTEDYVTVENFKGVYQAVEYLIQLGHRRIGFIKGMTYSAMARERWEGYQQALLAHGISYQEDLVASGEWTEENGYKNTLNLLSLSPPPTAIFASSDPMAIGAMKAIKERGLKIPDDISIIGFMDLPVAAYVDPPLTTVRMPVVEMGQAAAKALVRKILEPNQKQVKINLKTKLIIRESCKPNYKEDYYVK